MPICQTTFANLLACIFLSATAAWCGDEPPPRDVGRPRPKPQIEPLRMKFVLVPAGEFDMGLYGVQIAAAGSPASVVPLPSSVVMLMSAVGLLALLRYRRRNPDDGRSRIASRINWKPRYRACSPAVMCAREAPSASGSPWEMVRWPSPAYTGFARGTDPFRVIA